jgi:4-amino-4-deoxy-L-arabinose transferase-like glycosyltransferase
MHSSRSNSAHYLPAFSGLAIVLFLALLIRLASFNGAFGSDDLVYFERAAQLSRGDWFSSNYNGALRYGFNLPAAGFMAVFGPSIFTANLWPLACSLIEITAVYFFAVELSNRRGAIVSALLLALTPLHMAVATRIHADAVVSMFVTLSFVLLYFGFTRQNTRLLFYAGLSLGGIFWTKELAAVTWFAFLPVLWIYRRQWRQLHYVIAATILTLLLHGLLMQLVAGDPLHLVKVVLNALRRNFVQGGQGEDSASYYLNYLFLDLRHVGLIGILATAAVLIWPVFRKQAMPQREAYLFSLLWWLGLLAVLSVFPVSLNPLRWTMKQSNYLTLFLAPMAILASVTLSQLPRAWGWVALTVCLALGGVLGCLQQADYRAFTANTKSLLIFARNHPEALIIGSTHNSRLGNFLASQATPPASSAYIIDFTDLQNDSASTRQRLQAAQKWFVVLDQQTLDWLPAKAPIKRALPCWQPIVTLTPIDLGLGNTLANWAAEELKVFNPAADALTRLAQPKPAEVYRVMGRDVMCCAPSKANLHC